MYMVIILRPTPPIVGNGRPHFVTCITRSWKQLIEYVGIAWAIVLRRIFLPAQLTSQSLQLPIAPFTLAGMC